MKTLAEEHLLEDIFYTLPTEEIRGARSLRELNPA